ncbi:MAG: peptidase M28, partial [Steroidobacteraceae bacterium]
MRALLAVLSSAALSWAAVVCGMGAAAAPAADSQGDPIAVMVGRLDLEKYKSTIKGLTQFGDRRQGTDRNRAAIDWIEARLKSYGCANTVRLHYTYFPSEPALPSGP